MKTFSQNDAECLVYTFKEGMLSTVAHDLRIGVKVFHIRYDEAASTVEAEFEANSLEAICAVKKGEDRPGSLSKRDLKKINTNTAKDVLAVKKHPKILFKSTSSSKSGEDHGGGHTLQGDLTIVGVTKPISVEVVNRGGVTTARATIDQTEFGIRPFTALMGTIKVQPNIKVEIRLPDLS